MRYRIKDHDITIIYYPAQLLVNEKYGYHLQMQLLGDHDNWHLTRYEDEDGASVIDAVQHKSESSHPIFTFTDHMMQASVM